MIVFEEIDRFEEIDLAPQVWSSARSVGRSGRRRRTTMRATVRDQEQ
jgi:hypothetical protein